MRILFITSCSSKDKSKIDFNLIIMKKSFENDQKKNKYQSKQP
jgi:hypothetical protein